MITPPELLLLTNMVKPKGIRCSSSFFFCVFSKNVGQMRGYDMGIAAEFVPQLPRISSIQYRSPITGKDGPGGI
jgi:hypothetical protein